jgi:hypothetical protein
LPGFAPVVPDAPVVPLTALSKENSTGAARPRHPERMAGRALGYGKAEAAR